MVKSGGTKKLVGAPPSAANAPLGPVDVAALARSGRKDARAKRFSRYDADENGAVSREEYSLSRRKSYARLDLDGDGKLSFEEYAAKAVKKFTVPIATGRVRWTPGEFLATRVARKSGPKGNCSPPPA